jgi:hypothetical protein
MRLGSKRSLCAFPSFYLGNELKRVLKDESEWQTGSHLGRDDSKQCKQINIMPFIQTSLAESESASPKATTLHVYNVSLFLVACLLNRWQKALLSKQCWVPTKQGQRLDHATNLAASLPRQR